MYLNIKGALCRYYGAVTMQAMEEMVHASHRLDLTDDVKAIIITGEGTKAFAAGADIKEMASQTYSEVRTWIFTANGGGPCKALICLLSDSKGCWRSSLQARSCCCHLPLGFGTACTHKTRTTCGMRSYCQRCIPGLQEALHGRMEGAEGCAQANYCCGEWVCAGGRL
jgi:hypothetical protein